MSGGVLPSRELGGDLLNGVGQNRGENRAGRFIGRDPSPPTQASRARRSAAVASSRSRTARSAASGRTQRFGRSRIGEARAGR
jgi:hypothetical protein